MTRGYALGHAFGRHIRDEQKKDDPMNEVVLWVLVIIGISVPPVIALKTESKQKDIKAEKLDSLEMIKKEFKATFVEETEENLKLGVELEKSSEVKKEVSSPLECSIPLTFLEIIIVPTTPIITAKTKIPPPIIQGR
nr:12473_t:CDS:2 [Entrophospora candida]